MAGGTVSWQVSEKTVLLTNIVQGKIQGIVVSLDISADLPLIGARFGKINSGGYGACAANVLGMNRRQAGVLGEDLLRHAVFFLIFLIGVVRHKGR